MPRRSLYIAVAAAAFIVAGSAAALTLNFTPRVTYYEAFVDGRSVGYVADPDAARAALQEIKSRAVSEDVEAVALRELFTLKPVTDREAPDNLLSAEDLRLRLSSRLHFEPTAVAGVAITVDGQPVVYLKDEASARQVIQNIEAQYRERIQADGRGEARIEELAIDQKIDFVAGVYPPDEIVDPPKAEAILLRGTDKEITHVVQAGESVWSIARANNMSEEEVIAANPDLPNPNLIRIGDELSLVVPDPYLTLHSTEVRTYTEGIPYQTSIEKDDSLWPWERRTKRAGQWGEQEITVRISRENGQVVAEDVVATRVIKEPVTAIVVQGSKTIPDRGTGSLIWPLASGGQLTSRYGIRWNRQHRGIDIGEKAGMPIRAADAGTVVAAGWDGGYGYRVIIAHSDKMQTLYAHMSSIAVKPGQVVTQGQTIGTVGSTGRSTGPHLHFEVIVDGEAVNPLNFYQ